MSLESEVEHLARKKQYAYLITLEWPEYSTDTARPDIRHQTGVGHLGVPRGMDAEDLYWALIEHACQQAGVPQAARRSVVVLTLHLTQEG